jgi:hypothetical protein
MRFENAQGRAFCCVCGFKTVGIVSDGEFVCFRCHYEATGERIKSQKKESLRQRNVPASRGEIRNNLITERLKNKVRRADNEQREADD